MKTKIGNTFKYFVCCMLILFCALQKVNAQKYWTLQECVDAAIKNNITVKQRELSRESVKADALQTKAAVLPSVNGQATHTYQNGFAINPVTNTAQSDLTFRSNNMSVSANMVLFNGFQQSNNIRLQESNLKASSQDLESTKNTIRLSVANAYLQVLMNAEILGRNQIQTESTKQQIAKQQKLVELGAANRVKLLQLKAQLSNEELQIVTSQNTLDQSYLSLWQFLNIEIDTSNKIIKPELDITQIKSELRSASQIYQDYLNQSPDVKAAQIRVRSAELSKYVAEGGRSIRLNMSAGINSFYSTQTQQPTGPSSLKEQTIGYDATGKIPITIYTPTFTSFETTPFSDQFNRNLGKNLGFTLSVPLFNAWQVNTNVQKAKINTYSAHLTEKQVQNDLYKNITQAHQDFTAAQKNYEATENSFESNKESFSLAEGQFSLGAISTVDYLSTKNEFLKAQASFIQAKYQLVFRRKVLDFYLGKPLY